LQARTAPPVDLGSEKCVEPKSGMLQANFELHTLAITALELLHKRHERFNSFARERIVD
jgi:hypothetical protein